METYENERPHKNDEGEAITVSTVNPFDLFIMPKYVCHYMPFDLSGILYRCMVL
jgi:hypothetical protein